MGFQQGLSGLNASSKALDVVGNNIANSGTVGFKSANTLFADVYAASLGAGNQIGIGTSIASIDQRFTQGNITVTDNSLDLAINGQGFYRIDNNGVISWTRNGQFNIDKSGYIVNSSGYRLTGYMADPLNNNVIVTTAPVPISINTSMLQPQPTGFSGSGLQIGLNLDARESAIAAAIPFNITDPSSYNKSTTATVYDSLGFAHQMGLYFRKTAANTWDMYTNLDGGAPAGPTAVTFSTTGTLLTPALGIAAQSFAVTSGATTPLAFDLNLTGSTQYGNTFGVNSISQDGYTSGRLAGLNISSDGTIEGRYSNGQTRALAQVVLANFANPNGLVSLGNNQWAESADSGQPVLGTPGTGSLGVIQSAAVEESNVDLTAELVNMITYQRAYQANAQTIKTQDSIMQTLVNLR
jgi:flagellar hook protein FlgE